MKESRDGLAEAWNRASRIDFQGAYEQFRKLRQSGEASTREADLGIAISLLNKPPNTQSQIDQAEEMLAGIFHENSEDDTGIMAWAYYARIPYLHRRDSDTDVAFSRYEALANARPDHFFGQYARMQCVILDLLTNDYSRPGELDERLQYWESKMDHIVHPALVRNLSFVISVELIIRGGSLQRAQDYAIASLDHEPSRFDLVRFWQMRAINLSILNKDYATAKQLLEQYLGAYPGTWQTYAEEKLAWVEKKLEDQ